MHQVRKVQKLFDLFADRYAASYLEQDIYFDTLEKFLQEMGVGESRSLLEIGCGPGNISKKLLEIDTSLRLTGVDISSRMIEIAKTSIPFSQFQILEATKIDILQDRYDAIAYTFCFPYMAKESVQESLQKANDQLLSDGKIYISTIYGSYQSSSLTSSSTGEGPQIMSYLYNEELISELLQEAGFFISNTYIRNRLESDGSKAKDIIVFAQRKH